MFGTQLLKGQGLGNQLFCYISARCIAKEKGYEFALLGKEELAVNIHSQKGMYFMDMDLGADFVNPESMQKYQEKEERLFLANSKHDITHGCYVAGADNNLFELSDNTIIYGNLQSEKYFLKYKEEIKEWLKVKQEYESNEYSKENLCVINMRGGEYTNNHELYLERRYWINGIRNMRKIREDMEFIIVTDEVESARKLLPEIPAFHADLAKDYVTIKNASYLLLSNSSFAFFPVFTSETVKMIIAPKYWARHNVSNGYWSSEQNIYTGWYYQDRKGKLFTSEECRKELEIDKNKNTVFEKGKKPLHGNILKFAWLKIEINEKLWFVKRAIRAILRRMKYGK